MKRLVTASLLLLTLVSCSNAVQPVLTAVPTFEALPSAIPAETLQSFASAVSTVETPASAMPDSQGSPIQEWRGIPIMPGAMTGQEMSGGISYSFKTNSTAREVQDFYDKSLTELGWSQPFGFSPEDDGGLMVFRKDQSSLAITIAPSDNSVMVLLVLTLA